MLYGTDRTFLPWRPRPTKVKGASKDIILETNGAGSKLRLQAKHSGTHRECDIGCEAKE